VDDLIVQTGAFLSELNEKVPTLIVKQTGRSGQLPVVICLHGTGGSKESRSDLLRQLARRGYLAMAFDARYHGDRIPGGADGSKQYNDAVIVAWRTKRGVKQTYPFWYDTAYDLWRAVDYLVTREDVDSGRIGTIGFSMGGVELWLAAAVDAYQGVHPGDRGAKPTLGS
jgi:dienelactone hydrolase